MDFPYGETEIAYLRARDLKLGAAMDRIGPIHREVDPDLFSSVIHHIIGQQVSMLPSGQCGSGSRQRPGRLCRRRSRPCRPRRSRPWA